MEICIYESAQERERMDKPLDAEGLLRGLGVTRKLVGFRYVAFMVEQVLDDPDRIQLITKRLYPDTGRRVSVNGKSVERSTRNLIQFCWKWTDHSFLGQIAGTTLRRAPTNSEFIDMLAGYLRHFHEQRRRRVKSPPPFFVSVNLHAIEIGVDNHRQAITVFRQNEPEFSCENHHNESTKTNMWELKRGPSWT